MILVYDLIFLFSLFFFLPGLIIKRKFPKGILLRLGFLPHQLNPNKWIWIHAVSVGELNSVKLLLERLREKYPYAQFVISTVTSTANKIAKGLAKEGDFITYLPFDLSFVVRRVLMRIKPQLFIIVETEIWPNLINALYEKGIPVILVNARISQRSFLGYRKIKFFLKRILDKVSFFCAQTSLDANRLLTLGVEPSKIKITGNMKFDLVESIDKQRFDLSKYQEKLNFNRETKLWVCGSTHPGEEKIILSVYKELKEEFLNLTLLIAPRHHQRAKEIAKLVKKFSFEPVLLSTASPKREKPVFILDTVGELLNYYALADIVFVGGSLVKKGGHNILEPAIFSKPIIFGPYMFNFLDIAGVFLKENSALQVKDGTQLKEKLSFLLKNPDFSLKMGEKSLKLIYEFKGATQRNLLIIENFISLKNFY
ncbi:MAG: 3-deoxy-D-manno-octulosonic acid transferase [Candidatus Omnitrophica bacterium]|nr:3-deoxy-D-manno-octulosonic acid transferase [Candidatus Omnitrophota bacterium]